MPGWINRTQGAGARNGTTSHALPFAAATAGSLLVMIATGPVTSTTPAGWSLLGSAIGNTGTYAWTKTAAGGETSATTTHNGSNFPVEYVCYEYPAGSTIAGTVGTLTGQVTTVWATVTGLPGTAVEVLGVAGYVYTNGQTGSPNVTFTSPWIGDVDAFVAFLVNDGTQLSVGYQSGVTATSATPVGSVNRNNGGGNGERITFAVSVGAGGGGPTTFTTGQPSETDTAPAQGRSKARATGQPAETDTAPAQVRRKARTTGQPAETDTAPAQGRRKLRTTGQAIETDTALGSLTAIRFTTGQAAELDAALPSRRLRARSTGAPAELDTAPGQGRRKTRRTGLAVEVDSALPALLVVIPGRPVAGSRLAGTVTASTRPSTVEASDR